ncbi:Unknown protein [Striga hermonthica]|uniref:DUF4283 domain-containing protein n=1 Tax=Striga hermonthica TaxID=68872 RepID=A0A9N7MSK4_STRHE|nr:Unknown protein [Striga hermonthica]
MKADLAEEFKKFKHSEKEEGGIEILTEDIRIGEKECSLSLMGNLFWEKKANFVGLKAPMQNIWLTHKPFTTRMVGNNKYQFIFQSAEDRRRVLEGKAWNFDGQYLLLKEWSEENNRYTAEEQKIELWLQIHDLPLHWVSEEVGLKIGKLFNKVAAVVGGARGRIVKILVDLNLNEPLLMGTKLKMGGYRGGGVAFSENKPRVEGRQYVDTKAMDAKANNGEGRKFLNILTIKGNEGLVEAKGMGAIESNPYSETNKHPQSLIPTEDTRVSTLNDPMVQNLDVEYVDRRDLMHLDN